MTSIEQNANGSSFIPVKSRRTNTRVAALFPVDVVLGQDGSQSVLSAASVDLGMGGLCVKTHSLIDRHAIEAVRFRVGRHELELGVTSRWGREGMESEGVLTGLLFNAVDTRSEAALWGFIQERGRELGMFIRGCEGLSHLSFQESLELALETRLREVESGRVIYGSPDASDGSSIFLCFRGSVLLERAAAERHEEIAVVEPGGLFGGLPVVAGCPPIERAIATSRVTLLEFDKFNCEHMISMKPVLAAALLRAASFHWMRRFSAYLDVASSEYPATT